MISVTEAKNIIGQNVTRLQPMLVPLQKAAGSMLAADVHAMTDIPAFNQSAMDGYAFAFCEWKSDKRLQPEGMIPAGSNERTFVKGAKAVRIFTGAPVPEGADTVVMQEKTNIENGILQILDELLLKGANVRLRGADIRKGSIALEKETLLSPAAVGFLAGAGITEVPIWPDPVVSIILTGKELQQPGLPLEYGQVYESNSFSLEAALAQIHIHPVKRFYSDDILPVLKEQLNKALLESDIVLLTGGISVGDYDFVLEAAGLCGVETMFHKIKQRPGKPLFFGKKEHKLVFGLPGNPSSVLTCFYQYVIPAIEKMRGKDTGERVIAVPLAASLQKPVGLTCFLKGWYDGKTAKPLEAQESYRLSSFAKANCLIQVNEGISEYTAGEMVNVYMIT